MKKLILIFTGLLVSYSSSNANLSPGWFINIGGVQNDRPYELFTDASGNTYITGAVDGTGAVQNFSGYQSGTAKISPSGSLLWFKKFNYTGPDSTNEFGNGLAVDNNGNVYAGVNSWGNAATISFSHILKYDASGNLLWSTEVKTGGNEFLNCLTLDDAGNVYVIGRSGGDAFISKINSDGDSVWTYIDNNNYEYYEVVYKNNTLYVTGTGSIISFSTSGNLNWEAIPSSFLAGDYGNALFVDESNNVYTTGLKSGSPTQFSTIKVSSNGSVVWEKFISGGSFPYGYAVTSDDAGNVYSAGIIDNKFAVVKYSSSGDLVWIDSSASGVARSIIYKDESVLVSGNRGGFAVIEYNADNGNIIHDYSLTSGEAIEINAYGNKIRAGGTYGSDYYCVELNHILSTGVNLTSSEIPSEFSLAQNYPNPFNPSTKINFDIPKAGFVSIKIYDVLGKEVGILLNEELSTGSYSVDFNGSGLSSGVYFYRLNADGFTQIKKMILNK